MNALNVSNNVMLTLKVSFSTPKSYLLSPQHRPYNFRKKGIGPDRKRSHKLAQKIIGPCVGHSPRQREQTNALLTSEIYFSPLKIYTKFHFSS